MWKFFLNEEQCLARFRVKLTKGELFFQGERLCRLIAVFSKNALTST